jgi:hypothetical protein
MSKVSILKAAPLYLVWETSFPALKRRQLVLELCCYTSSRPHGMKSQNTGIFTLTTKIASDFIKIILCLCVMIHFDSCCVK